MPSQKSKFPSYGLVRGPSHERGGVAGMVADEQPVELEGGEWIVPKEAVPDYLPALIQMTNTGRMRQAMQNGNSAMDALIASASMQNGIAQPKSPVYQEGGVVDVLKKAMAQYGAPVDESLYTPQGGRSMLGMAQKYGITPESLNVDTLSFENPAKYIFEITGETPEGRQINIGEEGRGSLPLKQDVDKAIGEFYKDDLYGKMDAVKSLRSKLKGTSTKPQVDRQKEMMMKALNMSESEYDAFMEFKNRNKAQGGMIEYEDGGRVSVKSKLIDAMSESNGLSKGYSRADLETLDLDTLERLQSTMLERNIGDQYGGIEDALVSRPGSADMGEKRTYANRFDVRQGFGPDGNTSTSREQLSVGSLPVLATLANLASRAGVSGEGALGRVLNAPLPIERRTEDGRTSFGLSREQGGMIEYEDGGEVHSRRMYNQGTGFNKKKSDLDGDGEISEYERKRGMAIAQSMGKKMMGGGMMPQYQEGGQVQPRKQFELRNPDMFIGPPDSLVGRTYRNPFTGKYEDAEAEDRRIEQQTKRLLESMKKSNIPRSGQRMIMREGGPVPYQDGGQVNPNSLAGKTVKASDLGLENLGEVTDMPSPFSMSRPEFEAFTNSPMSEEEAEEMRQEQLSNLMSIIGRDMRIRPKQPDKYIVKNGKMSQTEMNIPKLSGAYLSSFGFETPYSRRQQALLQRKMIAPETLNPKVKGLINRALVQRLANEED